MTEIEAAVRGLQPAAVPARRTDENPYFVYLARFSGESQRTMRGCLDRIAATIMHAPDAPGLGQRIPWEQIRYPHVVLLRTEFTDRWSSLSHVNKHMSALRGVLRECWRLGLMTAEDYEWARDVGNVKGSREPAGRNIHTDEIFALLAACLADESAAHGIRDAALVAVLQSTGIRRAEAAAARIERYDHGERSLRVLGKGNKERTVYIHQTAVPYLDRWLVTVAERRGPVFRSVDRWGHIGAEPLSARAIGYILNERREQAGLPRLSTHDFRRTFVGDFIDVGGDLVQAQKLAGHASATTTASYDLTGNAHGRPEHALQDHPSVGRWLVHQAVRRSASVPCPHDSCRARRPPRSITDEQRARCAYTALPGGWSWPVRKRRAAEGQSLHRSRACQVDRVGPAGRLARSSLRALRARDDRYLDHSHQTGLVRGWLCHGCNTGEGFGGVPGGRFERYRERNPASILGIEIRYYSPFGGWAEPAPPPPPLEQSASYALARIYGSETAGPKPDD